LRLLGSLSRAKWKCMWFTGPARRARSGAREDLARTRKITVLISLLACATLGSNSGCNSVSSTNHSTQQTTSQQPLLGQLTLNSPAVSLGDSSVGTPVQAVLVAQNVGPGVVNLSQVLVAGSGFAATVSTLPAALPVGASVSIIVQFTPQAEGPASGSATIISDAVNSSIVVPLSGSGLVAPPHFVSLMWAASGGAGTGYNVFRSTTSGGPYQLLTAVPTPLTTFTDFTVSGGTTYYYVVAAVAENGVQSAFSPEASATVPSP